MMEHALMPRTPERTQEIAESALVGGLGSSAEAFGQFVTPFFEHGRTVAAEAARMPFSDGARYLMLQMRCRPPVAQEAIALAMLAEMQELAARLPA